MKIFSARLSTILLLIVIAAGCSRTAEAGPIVTVYKTPTCGCCTAWEDHMRDNGFQVQSHSMQDLRQIKSQQNVPQALGSCHTAVVEGYTLEGHVPADVIRRLIAERPAIDGIAVPGMPMGSPGMEGPYTENYEIFAFKDGVPVEVYDVR